MDANDTTPRQGQNDDGESSGSIARSLFDEELVDVDARIDRAATVGVRHDRDDLVEELAEHLREIADFLEEEHVDVEEVGRA